MYINELNGLFNFSQLVNEIKMAVKENEEFLGDPFYLNIYCLIHYPEYADTLKPFIKNLSKEIKTYVDAQIKTQIQKLGANKPKPSKEDLQAENDKLKKEIERLKAENKSNYLKKDKIDDDYIEVWKGLLSI